MSEFDTEAEQLQKAFEYYRRCLKKLADLAPEEAHEVALRTAAMLEQLMITAELGLMVDDAFDEAT